MRLFRAVVLLAALAACSSEPLDRMGGPTGAGGQHMAAGGSMGTGGATAPSPMAGGNGGSAGDAGTGAVAGTRGGGFNPGGRPGGGGRVQSGGSSGDTVGPPTPEDAGAPPPDGPICTPANTPCTAELPCCGPQASCFFPGTADGSAADTGICVYEVLLLQ